MALARSQGSIGGSKRGACKICGGMGHLTKQCKNHLSDFYNHSKSDDFNSTQFNMISSSGSALNHNSNTSLKDMQLTTPLALVADETEISSLSSEGIEVHKKSKKKKRKSEKKKRREKKENKKKRKISVSSEDEHGHERRRKDKLTRLKKSKINDQQKK